MIMIIMIIIIIIVIITATIITTRIITITINKQDTFYTKYNKTYWIADAETVYAELMPSTSQGHE